MEKDQETVEQEAVVETLDNESEEGVVEREAAESGQAAEPEQAENELVLQLEDARAKADEHWDQLVRLQAQMDNLRKRQERELANAHKFALERFVNELLPVIDSMELGLNAVNDDVDPAKLIEGSELTLKLFSGVMEKFNVVQVDPQGEPFDPELHQAMSMQPRDDVPNNTVVAVVQKGYTLNGRLVRPAMVMVSQAGSAGIDEQA